jgi:predicted nucleic acid-binding protein
VAYLIDTNVLSEAAKTDPDERVHRWLRGVPSTRAFISVLTIGEIRKGVELLSEGSRKRSLMTWLENDLPERFHGRILDIDHLVAEAWGRLSAEGRRAGRPLPAIDGLLLATAQRYRLTFVTRDVADCEDRGVPVMNPWSG